MSMTRLQLIGGVYLFTDTWIGHVLYGVPVWALSGTHIIGYDVYFPHAVGGPSKGIKTVWYFKMADVRTLDALKHSEKPRYTLVSSKDHIGEKVWAKVIRQVMSKGCEGCSFQGITCAMLTPACTPKERHDKEAVIFITEVAKW